MTDDSTERWDEDPGWTLGWHVLKLMVPGMLQREIRQHRGDGLQMTRDVFSSFVLSMIAFGIVLIFVPPHQGKSSVWALPALLAVTVVCLAMPFVVERPLDCSSDSKLAGSYRTRFFLRAAFAQAIALFAFVLYFITGPRWIYYLGAAIALVRMLTQAPTPSALVREQDGLNSRGCARSLVGALRHPRAD